jgi:hypothetical protein
VDNFWGLAMAFADIPRVLAENVANFSVAHR